MQLPQGVTFNSTTGRYRVRVKRGPRWHLAGSHVTPEAAAAALTALLATLPPRSKKRPANRDWGAEQARQRAALPPGTDTSHIYADKCGWTCKFWENGSMNYVGHYPSLDKALAARDEALATLDNSPALCAALE